MTASRYNSIISVQLDRARDKDISYLCRASASGPPPRGVRRRPQTWRELSRRRQCLVQRVQGHESEFDQHGRKSAAFQASLIIPFRTTRMTMPAVVTPVPEPLCVIVPDHREATLSPRATRRSHWIPSGSRLETSMYGSSLRGFPRGTPVLMIDSTSQSAHQQGRFRSGPAIMADRSDSSAPGSEDLRAAWGSCRCA